MVDSAKLGGGGGGVGGGGGGARGNFSGRLAAFLMDTN